MSEAPGKRQYLQRRKRVHWMHRDMGGGGGGLGCSVRGGGGQGLALIFIPAGGDPSPPPPLPPSPGPPPPLPPQLKCTRKPGFWEHFLVVGEIFSAPSAHAIHCVHIASCVLHIPCFPDYPHPPVSFPTPCRSPGGGGGGPSFGQPKIFHCGSLCCCVGGCVVGHYHLHPLHSWQDILLTFAEMELDSTTMFPPGTIVMFIRSTGEPVLAKVVGHSEHGDAYRRISYDRACKCLCTVGVWSPRGGWGTVTW